MFFFFDTFRCLDSVIYLAVNGTVKPPGFHLKYLKSCSEDERSSYGFGMTWEKLNCSSLRCQFGCQIERDGEMGCLCPPGLYLAPDNRTCKDINECDGLSHTCTERQSCRNTFGSFICVCKDGYVLGTLQDAVTCRDKDECLTGNHRCSHQASCMNTEGSYTCQCDEGYTGDGFRCWKRSNRLSWAAMYFQYKRSKQMRPV